MSTDITERALDLMFESEVAETLQNLSSTDVSAEWLQGFFESAVSHDVVPWQVGEAIAQTILENSDSVHFPWHNRRDERNPKASLPGADLVGISNDPDGHRLVFGEVKSSSDKNSPPGVLYGKSGMDQQLERLIDDPKLHFTLIKWLFARAQDTEARASFDEALASFVQSKGTSVRLIGVLVRDTTVNENDVSNRGKALGMKVVAPGSVELHAMYMPRPMAEWVEWVNA